VRPLQMAAQLEFEVRHHARRVPPA
jgi:hypothetical protein